MPEKKQGGNELAVKDPYRSYNFKLLIGDMTEGHFMECSGMGVKIETISYREAGNNQVVRKIPGPVEYGDIELKYGLTDSRNLWDWFMGGVSGNIVRKNVSIQLLDSSGSTPVMQWDLINAWASEWKGAHLDAMGKEIAIESVTLVYETMQRAGQSGGENDKQ